MMEQNPPADSIDYQVGWKTELT